MMLSLIDHFQIRNNLLRLTQGQRRLTNLMHLIELLDEKSRKEKLTPESTLLWLEMAIQDSELDVDSETLELRIATDDDAIQIRTQHTSKGLEFNFVFSTCPCPSAIDTAHRKPTLTYHDATTMETCFDAVDNGLADLLFALAERGAELELPEEMVDQGRGLGQVVVPGRPVIAVETAAAAADDAALFKVGLPVGLLQGFPDGGTVITVEGAAQNLLGLVDLALLFELLGFAGAVDGLLENRIADHLLADHLQQFDLVEL